MTDKFQELAEHLWATTHGNNFTQRMGKETIRFTLAQIHNAALEEAAMLHQDINPASDEERHHGDPGAGALGAVIEYRDKIRKLKVKP